MDIKVNVPAIRTEVVASPSGKNFSINVYQDSSDFDYQLTPEYFAKVVKMTGLPQDSLTAEKIAENFAERYESEAQPTRVGDARPYHILGSLYDHGLARRRRKLAKAFA